MDHETFGSIFGMLLSMPDNAASSAAAAAASAEDAAEAAESVTAATLEETKAYLGIS